MQWNKVDIENGSQCQCQNKGRVDFPFTTINKNRGIALLCDFLRNEGVHVKTDSSEGSKEIFFNLTLSPLDKTYSDVKLCGIKYVCRYDIAQLVCNQCGQYLGLYVRDVPCDGTYFKSEKIISDIHRRALEMKEELVDHFKYTMRMRRAENEAPSMMAEARKAIKTYEELNHDDLE